jgi:3-dehydroquinate synthetase
MELATRKNALMNLISAATRLVITSNTVDGNVIFADATDKTISSTINFAHTATSTADG